MKDSSLEKNEVEEIDIMNKEPGKILKVLISLDAEITKIKVSGVESCFFSSFFLNLVHFSFNYLNMVKYYRKLIKIH